MHQCYFLNAEKRKIRDRTTNAERQTMLSITALIIGVRLSEERIEIEDMLQIGEVDSITNCLTNGKLP